MFPFAPHIDKITRIIRVIKSAKKELWVGTIYYATFLLYMQIVLILYHAYIMYIGIPIVCFTTTIYEHAFCRTDNSVKSSVKVKDFSSFI